MFRPFHDGRIQVVPRGRPVHLAQAETLGERPEQVPVEVFFFQQARSDGFISSMNASEIGMAAMMLGAGRASKEDAIDYGAGIVLSAKTGDFVRAGQSLATLYTNHAELVTGSAVRFMNALTFSSEKPVLKPLIYEVIH